MRTWRLRVFAFRTCKTGLGSGRIHRLRHSIDQPLGSAVMLRIGLSICVALWAGSVVAQVTDDPRAVAPVVYSDAAPADAVAAPGADCVADTTTSECVAPADTVVDDGAPVVETDWDYYPGVSLWAYD